MTASAPTRAASLSDYRANVDRQSREQKSFGGILNVIVYSLVALFLLGSALAVYGAYILSEQIHQQSATVTDLDTRYSKQNQYLTAQIKSTNETMEQSLAQARAEIQRQQDLITHQQDSLNKLAADNATLAAALRQERQARASENTTLRNRIRDLEDQPRLR